MKIHEMICFTHELDMLEAHMEEHQHFVDKFFIKESPFFWVGDEKPLIFTENQERFSRFNYEIIVIPESFLDLSTPRSYPQEEKKKWYDVHRYNIGKSREYKWDEIAAECDYVLYADVDEIIDSNRAHHLLDILETQEYQAVLTRLKQHSFWVNMPDGKTWDLYRVFRKDSPIIGYPKVYHRTITPTIGWHFTNCYTPEGIHEKWKGIRTLYGHQAKDVQTPEHVATRIANGDHPFFDVEDLRIAREENVKRVLPGTDWAPKFMRENPHLFPWYPTDD